MRFFKNIHFKRSNVYVAESLLPRLGSFIFLPFLFRYVTTEIWAEIALMIAVSELLAKIYLFGFQSSIYRFANEIDIDQKNAIFGQLVKRILLISSFVFLIFEIFNSFFWPSIFEFEFGLPMRTSIIISIFSALNIFLTQYIRSLRQSRKLFKGSIIYTLLIVLLQFSSISYISINFGKNDRMMVTAYLVSLALSALFKSFYYLNFLQIKKISFTSPNIINIKEFLNYAKPAAGIGFSAIMVTHGVKLILQSNISLEILGKYFSYLSYAGIFFVIFGATQSYLIPKLFKIRSLDSVNFRITLIYYWTSLGIIYLLLFSKISTIFIPTNYELKPNLFVTIFLIQIFSANRTLAGISYDINKNLNTKLYIFVTFSFIFLIAIFSIDSLEVFLNLNLIFYFILGNIYSVISREWKLLINYNIVHLIVFFIGLNYLDRFIEYQNLILFFMIILVVYLTPKIINSYEKLEFFSE